MCVCTPECMAWSQFNVHLALHRNHEHCRSIGTHTYAEIEILLNQIISVSITANTDERLSFFFAVLFFSVSLPFLEIRCVDDISISFRYRRQCYGHAHAFALSFCLFVGVHFFWRSHHFSHEAIEHRLFSLMSKRENEFFIQMFVFCCCCFQKHDATSRQHNTDTGTHL